MSILFLFSGAGVYKYCHESFLFSIVNPTGAAPTKVKLKGSSNQNGIYCNNSYGPTFGGGPDLCIGSDSNVNCNSKCNISHTYECPQNTNSTFLLANKIFMFRIWKCLFIKMSLPKLPPYLWLGNILKMFWLFSFSDTACMVYLSVASNFIGLMSDISVETFCPFGVLKAHFPPQLYYTTHPPPKTM